jgi:UPF0755 protein
VNQSAALEISKGDSMTRIIDKLHEQHIAVSPFWFKALAYQRQVVARLQTGEYVLQTGMTSADLLSLFVSGKTKQYAITFPEGWTFKQLLTALNNHPDIEHTLQERSVPEIMDALNAAYSHPEGQFFPDTYFFSKHTSDFSILKRAYDKMQTVLNQEWQGRAAGLPLATPYQALVLASIVEKETAVSDERERVAGVFIRRLQKNMRLQTDPTVIYGMGDSYQGNIRRKDLTTATPYNTYVINGLPPTPIALPGKPAIHAALHPTDEEALYFVATGDERHVFSATLSEHNQRVQDYLKLQQ